MSHPRGYFTFYADELQETGALESRVVSVLPSESKRHDHDAGSRAYSWPSYKPYGPRYSASYQALGRSSSIQTPASSEQFHERRDAKLGGTASGNGRPLAKERATRMRARTARREKHAVATETLGRFECGIRGCANRYSSHTSPNYHRGKKHCGWRPGDVDAVIRSHNTALENAAASAHPVVIQTKVNRETLERGLPLSRLNHQPESRILQAVGGPQHARCFYCRWQDRVRMRRRYCSKCGPVYSLCATCMSSFHQRPE